MSTSKNEKIALIRRNLQSGKRELVMEGIEDAAENGDLSLVSDLLKVYKDYEDTGIRNALDAILSNLKISGTEAVFLEALLDKDYAGIHTQVLSFMWSSGLNVPEHLSLIVRVSLAGSFMQALEGFTFIESMEGPFPEEQVMDSILQVKAYLDKSKPGEMKELVQQLQIFLQGIDS